jgi:type IV pilus assembly protein PilF
MKKRWFVSLLALLVVGLSACVTEKSGHQAPEASANEAAQLNLELGIGYLRQGDLLSARDKLDKAIEQDPSLDTAYTALALVYEQLGDAKEAEYNYRRAVQKSPEDPDALNSLGAFLCRSQGRRAEALKYFDRALAVPLSKKFVNRAMLNTNAGVCVKPIDLGRAEAYLRAALAVDPKYLPALVQMADVAFEQGNYLQSRAFLERYMGAAPSSSPDALWLGVRIETALGDISAAEGFAARLRTEFPESTETSLLLEQERDAG